MRTVMRNVMSPRAALQPLHLLLLATVFGCGEGGVGSARMMGPDAASGGSGGAVPEGGPSTEGDSGGGSGGTPGTDGATTGTGGAVVGTGGGGSSTGGATSGTGGATGSGGAAGGGGASDPRCRIAWAGDIQTGTTADDQILGLTVDAEDNLIASGYEQGVVGVTNIEPDGNSRAVVMKFSPAGRMSWKAVLDTAGTDTAEDVAIDPASGNLVVLGRTSGAFPTFVNQGQFDLTLAVLDAGGQPLTVFQAGNERPQHPARLSLAPGGKVAVAGWDDTYVPSNFVAANQDGFFARFNVDPGPGHAVVQTLLQYTVPPAANALFTLATGVAAEQDGSDAAYVTFRIAGNHGTFVSKLRGDRSVAWTANISPLAFDAVNAVALSPTGELFITGGTFLTLGARSFGQEDAFLMKLDRETGAVIWAAQAGGPDTDYPTALAFDATGNVYISGYTQGSVGAGVTNQGSFDIFAMKFAAGGELLAVWQAGSPVLDVATSMAVDHCGNVFVGGYTAGAFDPGRPSAGGEDMFIVRAFAAPPPGTVAAATRDSSSSSSRLR